jgi:hypothetical protein
VTEAEIADVDHECRSIYNMFTACDTFLAVLVDASFIVALKKGRFAQHGLVSG